jgi:hypothetical protein
MENQRYQKIQGLVRAASILSSAEKSEWLELMELMNDRQLFELEKILASSDKLPAFAEASAGKQAASNREQNVIGQRITRPELAGRQMAELPKPISVPKPPAPKPVLPGNLPIASEAGPGPSFKHILNFPKTVGLEQGKEFLAKTFPPRVASRQEAPSKKESPFLAKLKAIFAEKELPPGVPSAAPAKPPVPVAPLKKIEPHPAVKKPEPKKPERQPIKKPAPVKLPEKKPERENITINLNISSPADLAKVPGLEKVGEQLQDMLNRAPSEAEINKPVAKAEPPPAPPQKPEVFQPPPVVLEVKSPNLPPQNFPSAKTPNLTIQAEKVSISPLLGKTPSLESAFGQTLSDEEVQEMGQRQAAPKKYGEDENVAPGLNFFEAQPAGALPKRPAQAGELSRAGFIKRTAKIILPERPGDDMKLETLEDAAGLRPADLKQHAAATILRKLQRLMGQKDRHEVVFNLEKSPLYKAYVSTGVAMLKDQSGLGESPQPGSGEQLDKEDFERFADLLILVGSKG